MIADFIFIFWGIYPFQLLNIDCLNKLEKNNCGDTVCENIRRFTCLVLYMSHRGLLVGLLGDRCFLCFFFSFLPVRGIFGSIKLNRISAYKVVQKQTMKTTNLRPKLEHKFQFLQISLFLDFDKKATAEIPKTNKARIGLTIHEI